MKTILLAIFDRELIEKKIQFNFHLVFCIHSHGCLHKKEMLAKFDGYGKLSENSNVKP
jgi:hypothetical protein